MIKRTFDVVMALGGLLVLAPVLLVIACLIRADSPGPVFFRQQRVGRHERPFQILKFRTMFANASGPAITIGADRRITRVGAVLRRYKLDELPQLFNVLFGEMSLVGPRPEVPRYVPCYPCEIRSKIFSVRPGLTDLASLEFIDEAEVLARAADWERAYIESVLPAKLQLAARYVDERSMGLDLQIIARTLRTLVSARIPRS